MPFWVSPGGLRVSALLLAGGIGLAAILFYGLKRAYDKNEEFSQSVNRPRGKSAGKAFKRISNGVTQQVLPALRKLADKGANALIDIFDVDKKRKDTAKLSGSSGGTAMYGVGIKQ